MNEQRRWIGGRLERIERRAVTQSPRGPILGQVSFLIGINPEHWVDDGPQPKMPFRQEYWSPSMRDGLDHVFEGQAVVFDVTTWDDPKSGAFQAHVHEIVDLESDSMIWSEAGPAERAIFRRPTRG